MSYPWWAKAIVAFFGPFFTVLPVTLTTTTPLLAVCTAFSAGFGGLTSLVGNDSLKKAIKAKETK